MLGFVPPNKSLTKNLAGTDQTHRDNVKVDISFIFCVLPPRTAGPRRCLSSSLPAAASSPLVPHLALYAAASPSQHNGLLSLSARLFHPSVLHHPYHLLLTRRQASQSSRLLALPLLTAPRDSRSPWPTSGLERRSLRQWRHGRLRPHLKPLSLADRYTARSGPP